MEMRAYPEIYVPRAQAALGDAFDYAVNICNISGNDFVKIFIVSSVSKSLEKGEPAYVSGMSGIELLMEILSQTTGKEQIIRPQERFSRTKEYWIGWAVAYYQWYSDRKYRDIFKAVKYSELERLYYTLHEADISKFIEVVDRRIHETFRETNLKRYRRSYGLSQSELARASGVSLRSIQMYEQRKKDINKASALSVKRLSKALGCTMEDLMEL